MKELGQPLLEIHPEVQVIYLIVIVAVRAETPGIQTASADRMKTMKMTCKKGKKTCEDVKLAPTKNMPDA